jgi:HEAT repeat protein
VAALDDPYWQVVKEALVALGKIRAAAPAPLLKLLGHSYSEIRKVAAVTLGAMGVLEAVDGLTALAEDDDIEVRKAASRALDEIALSGRAAR